VTTTAKNTRRTRRSNKRLWLAKPPGKPPKLRGAHAFEARKDGSLILYVTPPTGAEHWWDGEPIRIEPHRVCEVLAACGDALSRKSSTRR
jgi:hypothetical protein